MPLTAPLFTSRKSQMRRRIAIILNALTQLLASIICINLNANESTSGACYRRRNDSKAWWYAYKCINCLFFWEDNHCLSTAVNEVADSQELIDSYKYK